MSNKVTFNVQIKDVEQVNPLFSRCKVYICYSDLNRNSSIISKELINQKVSTLFNCPIVGEYSKQKNDFTDHGGKIEEDDEGNLHYIVTTVPYGLVPESSEIIWENIDGKDYLTCTAYLWTSRYPEALKVIEDGRPQSMEIEQVQGAFNAKKEFVITDFSFSALTILGADVEPCFEDAKIVGYSLDKQEFKNAFTQMIDEFKFALKNNGDTQLDTSIFNNQVQKEDDVVAKSKKEVAAQFSLTVNQLYDEMSRALSEITYETTNWYGEEVEMSRFYLCDFDDTYAYAVDRQNDYIDVKIPYSMSGDNVTLDVSGVARIKYVPMDWEGQVDPEGDDVVEGNFALKLIEEGKQQFDKVKAEKEQFAQELAQKEDALISVNEQFTQVKTQLEEKEQEIVTLGQFKKEQEVKERQEKIDALFTKYALNLSTEEVESLRSKESQFEKVEDFEKEVKSFVCDKIVDSAKGGNLNYSRMGIPPQHNSDSSESSDVWERLSNKVKQ